MENSSIEISAEKQIKRITVIGSIVNILLSIMKILGGKLVGSVALVADGVHSLSDVLTDVITYVGVSIGALPPDESHPYGHGKIETVAAILVSGVLVVIGALIIWDAAMAVYMRKGSSPGYAVLVLAVISMAAKEIIYQYTKKVAKKTNSPALMANAWHHRSDALSSLAVFIGGIVGIFGFSYADSIAGVIVALMVVGVGLKIGFESFCELVEKSASRDVLEKIELIFKNKTEIKGWHKLRSRSVGREIFIDVHLWVEPDLSVSEGHKIAEDVEEEIIATLDSPVNVLIHIEPYLKESEDASIFKK